VCCFRNAMSDSKLAVRIGVGGAVAVVQAATVEHAVAKMTKRFFDLMRRCTASFYRQDRRDDHTRSLSTYGPSCNTVRQPLIPFGFHAS